MMQRLLFLFTESPYGSQHLVETLESALVAAVFEQEVAILATGDAVWAFAPGQQGEVIGRRTPGRMLGALGDYDVEQIYVCAESLAKRGLEPQDLVLEARALTHAEQGELIARQHAVFT